MITITLNGDAYPMEQEQSLLTLVASLNLSGQSIAVAVNRQIISRSQWQSQLLRADDKVDVVRAIGGG